MDGPTYPVMFSVDYPDRELDRVTTFLPHLRDHSYRHRARHRRRRDLAVVLRPRGTAAAAGAGGLLFFGPLLMILFRQKYPRWWFDWNLELQRFSNRVASTSR